MKIRFGDGPLIFASIHGRNGKVRELLSVVSTGARYTLIPLKDAVHLGYNEVIGRIDELGQPRSEETEWVVGIENMVQTPKITLEGISIGELMAEKVQCLAYHVPEPAGVEVILGRTFLDNFRVTYDAAARELSLD